MPTWDIQTSAGRAAIGAAEQAATAYTPCRSDIGTVSSEAAGALPHSPATLGALSTYLSEAATDDNTTIVNRTATAIRSTREAIDAYVEGDEAMAQASHHSLAVAANGGRSMPGRSMV